MAPEAVDTEPLSVCTVLARNRLAGARVLARSVRAHHPSARVTALLIDDPTESTTDTDEPFRILRPLNVLADSHEFHRMATMYTVTELATALKPSLLRYLLGHGATEVTYLDPDIWVLDSLSEAGRLARLHSIVLTPHITTELTPELEQHFLRSGLFNLGFLAVGQGASSFLDWWSGRLARHCLLAPEVGLFFDQSWVNLASTRFDHYLIRDACWNVAPWNVSSRRLEFKEDRYFIDGERLRFFHFSGFDPEQPYRLARWFNPILPVLISDNPALGQLCRQYADALFAAGYAQTAPAEYGYGFLSDGVALEPADRRLYREALLAAERSGSREPPIPFEDGPEAFTKWLQRQKGEPSRPRSSSDPGHSKPPFEWPKALHTGVNLVVGRPSDGPSAVIEAAVEAALGRIGIPHSSVVVERLANRVADPFDAGASNVVHHDTTIICLPPSDVPGFAFWTPQHFFADRYSIGFWSSLGADDTALTQSLALLDEIWLEQAAAAENVARRTELPIFVVPLPLELGQPKRVSRSELGLAEGRLFLSLVDVTVDLQLERALALIEAFTLAFAPGAAQRLVVWGFGKDHRTVEFERLRLATQRPEVQVVGLPLDPVARISLIDTSDFYVSAQGPGEPEAALAEAMALARPIVAFPQSGAPFLGDDSALVLPGPEDEAVADLPSALRALDHLPAESIRRARIARDRILEHRNPEVFTRFMSERLTAIAAARTERGKPATPSSRRAGLRSVARSRAIRRRQS